MFYPHYPKCNNLQPMPAYPMTVPVEIISWLLLAIHHFFALPLFLHELFLMPIEFVILSHTAPHQFLFYVSIVPALNFSSSVLFAIHLWLIAMIDLFSFSYFFLSKGF